MSTEANGDELLASIPPVPSAAATAVPPPVKRGPGRPRKEPPNDPPDMFARTTSTTPGAELVPDEDFLVGATATAYWYWVGLRDEALIASIDCAGISFPKVNWEVGDKNISGGQRIPHRGALVKLDERKIERMRSDLKRIVLRTKGGKKEDDTGAKNVGRQPAEHLYHDPIRIPTREEIELAKKNGTTRRRYDPQPGDIPAATVMFAKLCADQLKPQRDANVPEPLSVTGLTWPVPIS